jgi:hypothetical protein
MGGVVYEQERGDRSDLLDRSVPASMGTIPIICAATSPGMSTR